MKKILENLDLTIKTINEITKIKTKLIDFCFKKNISEKQFYKITSVLTPQSRSALWQNYYISKNNCKKIKASMNKGDFLKNGIYYEYKSSGFNFNSVLHIVQVRIWQKCDYIVQYIEKETVYTFLLRHDQMKKELKLCDSSSAHGTKEANKENTNIEKRFTIKVNDKNWKRWVNNYLENDKKRS